MKVIHCHYKIISFTAKNNYKYFCVDKTYNIYTHSQI